MQPRASSPSFFRSDESIGELFVGLGVFSRRQLLSCRFKRGTLINMRCLNEFSQPQMRFWILACSRQTNGLLKFRFRRVEMPAHVGPQLRRTDTRLDHHLVNGAGKGHVRKG